MIGNIIVIILGLFTILTLIGLELTVLRDSEEVVELIREPIGEFERERDWYYDESMVG